MYEQRYDKGCVKKKSIPNLIKLLDQKYLFYRRMSFSQVVSLLLEQVLLVQKHTLFITRSTNTLEAIDYAYPHDAMYNCAMVLLPIFWSCMAVSQFSL